MTAMPIVRVAMVPRQMRRYFHQGKQAGPTHPVMTMLAVVVVGTGVVVVGTRVVVVGIGVVVGTGVVVGIGVVVVGTGVVVVGTGVVVGSGVVVGIGVVVDGGSTLSSVSHRVDGVMPHEPVHVARSHVPTNNTVYVAAVQSQNTNPPAALHVVPPSCNSMGAHGCAVDDVVFKQAHGSIPFVSHHALQFAQLFAGGPSSG
jgi:hypothetical protein